MGAAGRKLRVGIEFVGVVNGVPVAIAGKAHVGQGADPRLRRLDLELHADVVPHRFDPALLALGGMGTLLLVTGGSGEPVFSEDPLYVHLDWKLLEENYRDMGGFNVVGSIRADAGRLLVRGQFVEARTHMEPAERVVSVGGRDGGRHSGSTVSLGTDGLVLTTASSFETDFGNRYRAIAVSRIVSLGEGWKPASGLDVREVTVQRAGGREWDCRVIAGVQYGVLSSESTRASWDRE